MNFAKSTLMLLAHSALAVACSNDTSDGKQPSTESPSESDDVAVNDASAPPADAAEPNAAEPDAAPSNTSESNTSGMCVLPESAPPNCEACLADSCETQYTTCFCNQECWAQFEKVRDCFSRYNTFDEPSDDPSGDWATCEEEAGALSELYDDLMSCVSAEYLSPEEGAADDPWNRTDGDGQCSYACFDLFAFDFTP